MGHGEKREWKSIKNQGGLGEGNVQGRFRQRKGKK